MSGAPFRDLFVELPLAVFEALQAIGEGAAAKAGGGSLDTTSLAPTFKSSYPSNLSFLHDVGIGALLCQRYDWAKCAISRSAVEPAVDFRVTFLCGHRRRFSIDEMKLEVDVHQATALIDALDVEAD
jgi:hypothetical protein